MSVAWLFPGQGSQVVGMGKDLVGRYVSAAQVFEEANDALGIDLRALCFEGPAEELDRTANTQPALLATSIACLRAAEEAAVAPAKPRLVLGHSLGEFTGLVAAGALAPSPAPRPVRTPGEFCQTAAPSGAFGPGPRTATLGGPRALVRTSVPVPNQH